MNAHVLKWYRWQHFLATRQCRQLAQAVWARTYNDECDLQINRGEYE